LARTQQHGTSGTGFTQVTVTCIDGDKVVLATTSFANAGYNEPAPQRLSGSQIVTVADPGDYWMEPGRLPGLHTVPSAHILVTHLAWKAGDRMTDAVRVQKIKEGNYEDRVYDAKTGLCLHHSSSFRGPAPKYVGPGDMGLGDSTLSRGDLVGVRDISVPWAREAVPAWVAGMRALHYRGRVISRGPLPSNNTSLFADLQIRAQGHGWADFAATQGEQTQGLAGMPPQQGSIVAGRSQFGGLWIGPQALVKLQRGQILDEDPITKMRTAVTKADEKSIVISSRNAGGEIDSEYDRRTGMLIASSFYDGVSKYQYLLQLQRGE
jgi:hypothetical protein